MSITLIPIPVALIPFLFTNPIYRFSTHPPIVSQLNPPIPRSCCPELTGNKGAPLTQTLSANRTRLGLVRSLAFLPADRNVDFLPIVPIVGWHTTSVTFDSQALTNWITWSRGASFTSSPFTEMIWSPGSSWMGSEGVRVELWVNYYYSYYNYEY